MSVFGWSYPPGAAGDPYAPYNQQEEPLDITDLVTRKPANVASVWWTADGDILETYTYPVPAEERYDPCPNPRCTFGYIRYDHNDTTATDCPTCKGNGVVASGVLIPAHLESDERSTGAKREWDDELDDDANRQAAARAYDEWRSAEREREDHEISAAITGFLRGNKR